MGRHSIRKLTLHSAIAGLILAMLPAGANAEMITDYAPFFYNTGSPGILRLEGEINVRSPLSFNRVLRQYPAITTLELSSPGGSVYAALTMAPDIRDAGLKTVIPVGAQCFSACAFMFFAGAERAAEGELGVHQVSAANLASGQFAVGDIVAVLDEFDVPSEVLVKMLQTPSEDMYVMSPGEMQQFGLLAIVSKLDTSGLKPVTPDQPFEIGLTKSGNVTEYQTGLIQGALRKAEQEKLSEDQRQALFDGIDTIPDKLDTIEGQYRKGEYINALMSYSEALDIIDEIYPDYGEEVDVVYFGAFSVELLMKVGMYAETAEVAEQIITAALGALGTDHEVIVRCRKLMAEAKARQ